MTVANPTMGLPNPMKVHELAQALRIHHAQIYRAIAANELRVLRVGKHGTRIPHQSVAEWLRLHSPMPADAEQP
jgi:excisionase family DNA binding protein